MILPKTIRIAGQTIKICLRDLSDEEYLGSYLHDKKTIVIHSKLNPGKVRETMWHEMFHAWLACSGLSAALGELEETFVVSSDEIFRPAWDRLQKKLNQ